jgi:hypothetical protein
LLTLKQHCLIQLLMIKTDKGAIFFAMISWGQESRHQAVSTYASEKLLCHVSFFSAVMQLISNRFWFQHGLTKRCKWSVRAGHKMKIEFLISYCDFFHSWPEVTVPYSEYRRIKMYFLCQLFHSCQCDWLAINFDFYVVLRKRWKWSSHSLAKK